MTRMTIGLSLVLVTLASVAANEVTASLPTKGTVKLCSFCGLDAKADASNPSRPPIPSPGTGTGGGKNVDESVPLNPGLLRFETSQILVIAKEKMTKSTKEKTDDSTTKPPGIGHGGQGEPAKTKAKTKAKSKATEGGSEPDSPGTGNGGPGEPE
jgi:hypothetical protein